MKVIIPGGSGQVGQILCRAFSQSGDEVVILSRSGRNGSVCWDGKSLGNWTKQIDGADVVINLAGRSVNCRYTKRNLQQMLESRVHSTRVIGKAIAGSKTPPTVWLQMSTATIYSHRFDAANDERNGRIGGSESDVPDYWKKSIEIAQAWETTLNEASTPHTRRLALRSAMVMSPDRGGILDVLSKMTRLGLGGRIGSGRQFVSWIHESDFVRSIRFLIDEPEFFGAVNLSSPCPLPQAQFMKVLRDAWGIRVGLPATKWMATIGALLIGSDTELLLKSRRVVPGILQEAGFRFEYPGWADAAADLVGKFKLERKVAGTSNVQIPA